MPGLSRESIRPSPLVSSGELSSRHSVLSQSVSGWLEPQPAVSLLLPPGTSFEPLDALLPLGPDEEDIIPLPARPRLVAFAVDAKDVWWSNFLPFCFFSASITSDGDTPCSGPGPLDDELDVRRQLAGDELSGICAGVLSTL